MTKNVVVTVLGSQEEGDISLSTCGTYVKKNDVHYVFYEELVDPDSPPVKNRMRFDNESFELTKKGAVNSQMLFDKNKITESYYQTVFGPIDLKIVTEAYIVKETDKKIEIDVSYTLGLNQSDATRCTVHVDLEAMG